MLGSVQVVHGAQCPGEPAGLGDASRLNSRRGTSRGSACQLMAPTRLPDSLSHRPQPGWPGAVGSMKAARRARPSLPASCPCRGIVGELALLSWPGSTVLIYWYVATVGELPTGHAVTGCPVAQDTVGHGPGQRPPLECSGDVADGPWTPKLLSVSLEGEVRGGMREACAGQVGQARPAASTEGCPWDTQLGVRLLALCDLPAASPSLTAVSAHRYAGRGRDPPNSKYRVGTHGPGHAKHKL
ncbi:hypothetical protein H1C71_021242 [Ictidomys tridecemlineatus]|nr:hypothetical protein H1C71_021242 [Ictidomys tridecemlineatus]